METIPLLDCLINTEKSEVLSHLWRTLLKGIDNFCSHNTQEWLRNVEVITIDFCDAEQTTIKDETIYFLTKHKKWKTNSAERLIQDKLCGCKLHFFQSFCRVKRLVKQEDQQLLERKKIEIMNCSGENDLICVFDYIETHIPFLTNWTKYWKQHKTLQLLLN